MDTGYSHISSNSFRLGIILVALFFHLPLSARVIHVDVSNTDPTRNGSELHPYDSIQLALDNALSSDTLKVSQGTYHENIVFPLSRGVVLLGGYQSGNYTNRNINSFETVLSGAGTSPVMLIEYSGGYGDHQIFEIDGLTIESGQRGIYAINYGNGGVAELRISNAIVQHNSGLTGSNDHGGGIYSRGMIPEIKNNVIRNNRCGKAGGIAVQLNTTEYSILLEGNIIENNEIYSDHGAGAGVQALKGAIRNNIFRHNKILESWGWGGGLIIDGNMFAGFSDEIYLELSNNIYSGNEAPSGGAGLFIDEGANVRMKNELLLNNICSDSFRSGALYVDGPRATGHAKTILENCTIADNIGAEYSHGHAIFVEGDAEVIAKNSIFWGNRSSDNQNDFYVDDTSSLMVDHSIYATGKSGDGAFSIANSSQTDPLFAAPISGDYHVKSKGGRWNPATRQWVTDPVHSPAIDAGDPASSYAGEPSPNGARVNLGCYGNTIYASKSFSEGSGLTYRVGPTRQYQTLQEVAELLNPGDIVEVDGDHTYPGGVVFTRPGTASEKIHLKGVRINGNRPVISGGYNGVAFTTPWPYTGPQGGHHYVFEGFEITGAEVRGIFHQANDLTIRDCFVHDCLAHGILGADQGSGSLLLEYTEVARCGEGGSRHQIYMATDQVNNPGSVFRMQHCFIHQGNGGNNVKSRAERNEIYYNWIEGAFYHELELIGADSEADGGNPSLAREDSDVVGNVLLKKRTSAGNDPNFYVIRIGGDGTGESHGRYRFLNNTIISGTSAVFRLFDSLETIEIQNNVFYHPNGDVLLMRTVEAKWVSGQEVISGKNNWVKTGARALPAQLTGTVIGDDPSFVDRARDNYYPAENSPLVNAGILPTESVPGFEFPNPLPAPLNSPVNGAVEELKNALIRTTVGIIDIGAFEYGFPTHIISDLSVPERFVLHQNYPNPFNSSTRIGFSIPEMSNVKLTVYNILGQEISVLVNGQFNAGHYIYNFNSNNLSSGAYLYEIRANDFVSRKKMTIFK